MRCVISYLYWKGARSGGSTDFGVVSETDPRIEVEKQKLIDRGCVITGIRFY